MPKQKRQSTLKSPTSAAHDATSAEAAAEPEPLSKATSKIVESVREPFISYTQGFVSLQNTRQALAPKFMKAYNAWAAETSGTFVSFVRLYDPSIPMKTADYIRHSSYNAADYLRRLVAQKKAAETATTEQDQATKPVSAYTAVARLVATLAPFVEDMDLVWKAFVQELHWTERQIASVQKQVGQAGPLLTKQGQERKLRHFPPAVATGKASKAA